MGSPLNSANHSMSHSLSHSCEGRVTDIRSFYQSLSPNKSKIIRINTNTTSNTNNTSNIDSSTDSQKPIFHLNKTKTFIKSLKLENNLSVNGLTSDTNQSNDSIVVYRLSNDKNKDLLRRSTPSSQSTPSSDTTSYKKRYLVSQRSGKVYEILEKPKVSPISVKREASEPDTDLICDDEYFKYLNLIGSKRLKTDTKSLNQWSLRNISKVVPNPKYDNYGKILLTEVCPKPLETNPTENEDNSEVSRRKLAKSQWLTEVKDNTNRFDNKNNEISRKRDKELREWNTNILNTISFFELSSFMAKRLMKTHFKPINQLEKYIRTLEFEKHCADSYVKYLASMSMSSNFYGSNGVTRITRTRDGSDWNPRNYQHNYCFNRLQRLEKWKQLETGLNWRSRLLKSNCKKLALHIQRVNNCPICTKTIEFEPRHQCYEFEPHLRPVSHQKSASISVKDSKEEEEVIIIGDDFMSEDMITNKTNDQNYIEEPIIRQMDTEVIKTNNFEVIKDNDDEEEDEIMIVKEVFKTKDSNVIIESKPPSKSNIYFKSVKPSKRAPTVSLNFMSQTIPHELSISLPSSSFGSDSHRYDRSDSLCSASQMDFIFDTNLFK